ncbi:MAG: HipA domain-containing protein [Ilumatobacteraceae bacterium]
MTKLNVWLAGEHVATITENRSGMSMIHTDTAQPLGAPLVSMSMPVASQRYGDKTTRPFFHGLLPEGEARSIIAYDLGLDSSDDMGLLRALGKDCAGALAIQTVDESAPPKVSAVGQEALQDTEIERLLAALPVHPLGFDGKKMRVSLAGIQPKLLLAQTLGGQWSLPTDGVISTHILKPASRVLPRTVQNEAFCMIASNCAQVTAAHTTLEQFGGAAVLVSRRFDRRVTPQGTTMRIHQEDACQALSILTAPPDRKYQRHTPSLSLVAVSQLLDQWGEPNAAASLLAQLAFNVIIGNADYHGKNISFLHEPDGTVRLAPLYDAMCTVCYSGTDGTPNVETELGLHISNKTDINDVTMEDIASEASRWGMRQSKSLPLISNLLERLPDAINYAANEIADVPDNLVTIVQSRLAAARSEITTLRR